MVLGVEEAPANQACFLFFFLISSPPPCLCFLSDATSHPTPTVTFTAGGRKRLSVCFSSAVKIRRLDSSIEGNGGEKRKKKRVGPVFFRLQRDVWILTARPNKAPGGPRLQTAPFIKHMAPETDAHRHRQPPSLCFYRRSTSLDLVVIAQCGQHVVCR